MLDGNAYFLGQELDNFELEWDKMLNQSEEQEGTDLIDSSIELISLSSTPQDNNENLELSAPTKNAQGTIAEKKIKAIISYRAGRTEVINEFNKFVQCLGKYKAHFIDIIELRRLTKEDDSVIIITYSDDCSEQLKQALETYLTGIRTCNIETEVRYSYQTHIDLVIDMIRFQVYASGIKIRHIEITAESKLLQQKLYSLLRRINDEYGSLFKDNEVVINYADYIIAITFSTRKAAISCHKTYCQKLKLQNPDILSPEYDLNIPVTLNYQYKAVYNKRKKIDKIISSEQELVNQEKQEVTVVQNIPPVQAMPSHSEIANSSNHKGLSYILSNSYLQFGIKNLQVFKPLQVERLYILQISFQDKIHMNKFYHLWKFQNKKAEFSVINNTCCLCYETDIEELQAVVNDLSTYFAIQNSYYQEIAKHSRATNGIGLS